MKLSEMINNLQKALKEHGDLDCLFCNDYGDVFYEPMIFYQNKKDIYDYISEEHFQEELEYEDSLNKEDYKKIIVIMEV